MLLLNTWGCSQALTQDAGGRGFGVSDASQSPTDVEGILVSISDSGLRRLLPQAVRRDRCAPIWTTRSVAPFEINRLGRGPSFRDLRVTQQKTWLAVTRDAICSSDDQGESWRERASLSGTGGDQWILQEIGTDHRWLFAQTHGDANQQQILTEAWISSPDESWAPLAMPQSEDPVRSVVTDGVGRVYAQTRRQLFVASYGARRAEGWLEQFALPGREALVLMACGRVVLTQSQIDDDGSFWFRSFDHGAHWSPFLLGQLGLDADHATVRCLGARGGIEAGRGPLPSHWSFDGGRTWSHALYDDRARRMAREQGTQSVRCQPGPTSAIECRDDARSRMLDGSRPDREIYAPGWCDAVTQLDSLRTLSFGCRCGLLVSGDHGGLWKPLFTAATPMEPFAIDGQGGLLASHDAWRLDGGIWWTHDDGARWTPVASVIGRTLTRGVFVDRNRGVFSTRNGWIVSTRDGGRTWVYVLRGDVERISSDGPTVFVTTTTTVRVSPDGGEHWWSPGVGAAGARVVPVVQRQSASLVVQLPGGHRIEQTNGEVRWVQPGQPSTPVLSLLVPELSLVAATMTPEGAPKVLLSDGSIALRLPPSIRTRGRSRPRRRSDALRQRSHL